jgi:hypothetical protein
MLVGTALPIGILDSQHMSSTHVAGEEPVEEGRPRSTNVEIAGG